MNYPEYKDCVTRLRRPTNEQTTNFIEFVGRDHSWYKHLPENREAEFIFYLDVNAGKKLIEVKKERYYFDEESGKKYQSRFGHWNYFATLYTVNYIPLEDGSIRDPRPIVGLNLIDNHGTRKPFPNEVAEMGTFYVSRYLHNEFSTSIVKSTPTELSSADKHEILINDIKGHLLFILDNIYGPE
jgi:hypothetical protein